MRKSLATLAVVIFAYAYVPRLDVEAYPIDGMPANLAAHELAEEPDYAAAKLTTLRIESPGGICSGTVIDHHKVLTATHCLGEDGAAIADMRLGGRAARIFKVEKDAHDAVILTTDLYFRHVAKFGPTPKQGDVTFSHGNPAGTPDVLLVGRVAGWVSVYAGVKNTMLLDRNDWYGCSGAAVFDRDGRIIGVVNAIYPWPQKGWRMIAVYPLTFTKEQLTREKAA
jgi:S1-C subfamily serine protease